MSEKQESLSIDDVLLKEGLDEDTLAKTKVLFEAAVNERVSDEIDRLHDLNEKFVQESIDEKVEELNEKADKYLSYVADEYLKENEIALEAGHKVDAAEKILEGVSDLLKENEIHLDEEDLDSFAELEEKFSEQESDLNTKIDENIQLTDEIKSLKQEMIIDVIGEGLSDVQKEKLSTLTEDFDFDLQNEDEYISKVKLIKESFFNDKSTSDKIDESLDESVEDKETTHHDSIQAIVSLLNKKD